MVQITGKKFAGLLAYTLKFPLFIDEKDLDKGDNVNVVLPIRCFDPDKKAEQKHHDAIHEALREPSLEKRVFLLEKASIDLEKSNYESYAVGTISYTSLSGISGIKAFAKIDGEAKELIIRDGEMLDGLFDFLENLSAHYNELVVRK